MSLKVYQNIFLYPNFVNALQKIILNRSSSNFNHIHKYFLEQRYGGVHYLEAGNINNVFINSDSLKFMNRIWALENNLPRGTSMDKIIYAQIEEHKSDVFYTQNPAKYSYSFLKNLPGSVKHKVCWQSPPGINTNFKGFDLVLNNFPKSLEKYSSSGIKTAYFCPSFDPGVKKLHSPSKKPIDVVFIGGYSRHHSIRNAFLSHISKLGDQYKIVYSLDISKYTASLNFIESYMRPLSKKNGFDTISQYTIPPLYGMNLYRLILEAKITINCAVDSAMNDRGNMRCFETMSCGSLLISDSGKYPKGFIDGQNFVMYKDFDDAEDLVLFYLENEEARKNISTNGRNLLKKKFSKELQWSKFCRLIGTL